MQLTIKIKFSDKLGTHYELYLGTELIHYEFSRVAVEKIVNKLSSGLILSEIIREEIQQECAKETKHKIDELQDIIRRQNERIKELEKENPAIEHGLSKEEARELETLLTDMKVLNFTYSSELSHYIKKNKLGRKYPIISGIVKMQEMDETWDFEGGFPKHIYTIICQKLKLKNNSTSARAIGFTAYKDISP